MLVPSPLGQPACQPHGSGGDSAAHGLEHLGGAQGMEGPREPPAPGIQVMCKGWGWMDGLLGAKGGSWIHSRPLPGLLAAWHEPAPAQWSMGP